MCPTSSLGRLATSRARSVHGLADRQAIGRHRPSYAALQFSGLGCEARVSAKARGLGQPKAGGNPRRHLQHAVEERARHGLPAVNRSLQAAEIAPRIIRRAPLQVEHGWNLAEERYPVPLDGLETLDGIEDFQRHRGRAHE